MHYIAKYPTAVHSFILSLMLIQGTYQMLQAHYGRGVVQLSIGMIILFSYFIRYEIKLDETKVQYEILFLGHTFYSKKIAASDIRKIVFKRVGWSARGAFIYTDKLFPIRLINFKPDNMYNQLDLFGKKNGISIISRKDFMEQSQSMTKES
ncbi:hypothetical protein FZC76_20390 [Sutcliffiella horikoshii]|uniref:Uncharacterized protein n=1 Tax=Sutcliffiella horikoshii TaxID=79883 RepID=A0A5D4SKC1_9BACI|nr:hypothetical protein [Sutcliffiella horikoshii]TYS62598.1 hypothetical protein FZC76_20390 [Sutcliffiella horikoshii]